MKAHESEKLITDTVNLGCCGTAVDVDFDFESPLFSLVVDQGQFKQVIGNLVINALQSMDSAGRLVVSARNHIANVELGPTAKPSNYVQIDVQDFGTGIPAGIKDKILDPYYTTKDYGSGLELSTSLAIVQQHAGHLDFQSNEGKGTTFSVFLPAETRKPGSVS